MSGGHQPSSPIIATDYEDDTSFVSAKSPSTVKITTSDSSSLSHRTNASISTEMPESDIDSGSYGTPIQKFSKEMINSLSKYKVTEDLTDSNYPTWSQSVKEVFVSMSLDNYIKIQNYSDDHLSKEKNRVTAFNITTYILNRLNDHNNTQVRNHLTNPEDPT